MIGCLPTQAFAFLAVFVYATHATQAIALEWKPGLIHLHADCPGVSSGANVYATWDLTVLTWIWYQVFAECG